MFEDQNPCRALQKLQGVRSIMQQHFEAKSPGVAHPEKRTAFNNLDSGSNPEQARNKPPTLCDLPKPSRLHDHLVVGPIAT